MFFEEGALFEQNQCSSGISRMNFVSQTERLRSLEADLRSLEAGCQLLHHQLIDTTRTSSQHIAALESENLCLRMELAYAKQFAPRLYMDLPRPHFSSESASSSSSASTQPTIAAITPVASMRINNLGLDYTNFLARPALGFQSVNYPSGSTPPNGDSHLPQ